MTIDFSRIEDVQLVLDQHRAVKLLRKDHAGLIIAFLWSAFKVRHRQTYAGRELTTLLSDFLFSSNEAGEKYPREPRDYLESWTQDGFLRQYYEDRVEEVTFELTPAAERALLWITELDKQEFVGAESRLLQVFDLLRDLALGTSQDKTVRLEQLRRRQTEIEREIDALENDRLERMDSTRVRERYFLLEEAANKLQSDFRQIEANFRRLNARAREEQIKQQGSRGTLLDEIFDTQDTILQTDQGKTFTAFWAFLMNQERQDELDRHLSQIFDLPELDQFRHQSLLPRLKMALVEAGDRVNKTTDRLIDQLRRFLQSRAFLETQRTVQLIGEIEQLALQVKNDPPKSRNFATVENKAKINLTMDRGPFDPPEVLRIESSRPEAGAADGVDATALFDQVYIDRAELSAHIEALLRHRDQVSLREVVEARPLQKGLSELIGYFGIATAWEPHHRAVIESETTETIHYRVADKAYAVELPRTLFLP